MKVIAVLSFILAPLFLSLNWTGAALIAVGVSALSAAIAYVRFSDKLDFNRLPRDWWGGL